MLHRLEIQNFYSIRDLQVIDLAARGHAPEDPQRLAPAWAGAAERAPKVVALFGANGSGKSNVLRAISFLTWFVTQSFSLQPDAPLPFLRFADQESIGSPTRLMVQIAGIEDFTRIGDANVPECRMAYEVVIGNEDKQAVEYEAIHYWPSTAKRRVRLFERNKDGKVVAAKEFGLTGYAQALEKVLRPNASVIATLAQLQHPISTALWNVAQTVTSNILLEKDDRPEPAMVQHFAANPDLVQLFNQEIERVDVGIRSLEVVQGQNGPNLMFVHEGLVHPIPLVHESQGTRQFLHLYPLIKHALQTGGLAVMDELDSALHPLLLIEILRWFHDPETNPEGAQLWMSCQSASLLEELTKEEILFCEKDRQGRSAVYGLWDIQAVRRGENYYKKYLSGVYGAVPTIG